MDKVPFKKGRQFFETSLRANHVTFDDGRQRKSNLPWNHYAEARCDYLDLDTIYVTMGEWLIVLTGQNLAPLYAALEDQTLTRVVAHPQFEDDATHADDTFVTGIRFVRAPPPRPGQMALDL